MGSGLKKAQRGAQQFALTIKNTISYFHYLMDEWSDRRFKIYVQQEKVLGNFTMKWNEGWNYQILFNLNSAYISLPFLYWYHACLNNTITWNTNSKRNQSLNIRGCWKKVGSCAELRGTLVCAWRRVSIYKSMVCSEVCLVYISLWT